ncbi:hypothetical protein [Chryseobacterium sp. CT-SW4]|uniref:hypothetical protein n=1 Tax=Chryseobacterium sp. SW-1 TaxID=3157343 RepID=UPI003B02B641
MKKINQINQQLLEKYPTLWNTKIVWMLLAGIIVHMIFFIIGYLSHMDPRTLQRYSVKNDYFETGIIFIHLIISILMIVGWLIMMFKNNAFKNFYPTSKGKLFTQFVQYFIIVFCCITFYFSYMLGFKVFLNQKYPEAETNKNIEIINRAYPFLSQNLEPYTLENRLYPQPFFDLFCETDIHKIDKSKKYFVYYDRAYQFSSIYAKTSNKTDREGNYIIPEPENTNKTLIAFTSLNGDSKTFYFKKDVVDLSSYIKTTHPSYYNFADIFYIRDENNDVYNRRKYQKEYVDNRDEKLQRYKAEINKQTVELLNKNNPAEIEKLLSEFLKISEQYRISTNLDAKSWTRMVVNPPDFEVKSFIKKNNPQEGKAYGFDGTYYPETAVAEPVEATTQTLDEDGNIINEPNLALELNPELNVQLSPDKYFKQNITDYYYYSDNLKDLLGNVESMRSYDFFLQDIHIYLWISFFLSVIIFCFRITGLKSLLFSIISSGIIILAVTLVTVLYSVFIKGKEEYFAAYLGLIIGLIILMVPLFRMKKTGKMISSVFVNISMTGFTLFVFLIFGIISMHQNEMCREVSDKVCTTLIEDLGLSLSYILLIFGFVFLYLYTSVLQKWKAMPE